MRGLFHPRGGVTIAQGPGVADHRVDVQESRGTRSFVRMYDVPPQNVIQSALLDA